MEGFRVLGLGRPVAARQAASWAGHPAACFRVPGAWAGLLTVPSGRPARSTTRAASRTGRCCRGTCGGGHASTLVCAPCHCAHCRHRRSLRPATAPHHRHCYGGGGGSWVRESRGDSVDAAGQPQQACAARHACCARGDTGCDTGCDTGWLTQNKSLHCRVPRASRTRRRRMSSWTYLQTCRAGPAPPCPRAAPLALRHQGRSGSGHTASERGGARSGDAGISPAGDTAHVELCAAASCSAGAIATSRRSAAGRRPAGAIMAA
jgi:hypothetical protein